MEKNRVLFIASSFKADGISDYSKQVFSALKKLPNLIVLFNNFEENLKNTNSYDLIHIQHHYSYFGKPLPFLNSFPRYLANIHKPVIITVHDIIVKSPDSIPLLLRPILTWSISLLNRQTFLNSKIKHFIVHAEKQVGLLTNIGVKREKISVIPMGVPAPINSSASPAKSKLKQKWGLKNRHVLTIVGFIYRRKGYDIALNALKKMKSKDAVLVIAGDTNPKTTIDKNYKNELLAYIEANHLADKVLITGYLNEKDFGEVLAMTDIVLSPIRENFGSPYSLSTAIGYGKPIVSSNIEPVKEIYERMPCLELFRDGNYEELAAKLDALISQPKRLHKLAQMAKSYAKTYSFDKCAEAHSKIYESVIHN